VGNIIEELVELCRDVGGKIEAQRDLYTCRLPERKRVRISFGRLLMFRGMTIEIDGKAAGLSTKRGKWEFRVLSDSGALAVSSGAATMESYADGYSFRVLRENGKNIAEIKLI
jgi:hypothetical protein